MGTRGQRTSDSVQRAKTWPWVQLGGVNSGMAPPVVVRAFPVWVGQRPSCSQRPARSGEAVTVEPTEGATCKLQGWARCRARHCVAKAKVSSFVLACLPCVQEREMGSIATRAPCTCAQAQHAYPIVPGRSVIFDRFVSVDASLASLQCLGYVSTRATTGGPPLSKGTRATTSSPWAALAAPANLPSMLRPF